MATSKQRPDAITLLKEDHREVERLFKRFEELGPRAHTTRRKIVDKLIEALSVHAGIEEEVFYPAVRERVPDATSDVLEALEEHHLVKTTLAELERLDPEDERFVAKVTVLIENVRHHVKEEEKELFPDVRKELTRSELTDLGAMMRDAKSSVPTRPHPHGPDAPPANLVANAVTAPVDAAVRAVRSAAGAVTS